LHNYSETTNQYKLNLTETNNLKEYITLSQVETRPFSMRYVPASELSELKYVCII